MQGRIELSTRKHAENGKRVSMKGWNQAWCSIEERKGEWAFVSRQAGPSGSVDCTVSLSSIETVAMMPCGDKFQLELKGFGPYGEERHLLRFEDASQQGAWKAVLDHKVGDAADTATIQGAAGYEDLQLNQTVSQKADERAVWKRKELSRCLH